NVACPFTLYPPSTIAKELSSTCKNQFKHRCNAESRMIFARYHRYKSSSYRVWSQSYFASMSIEYPPNNREVSFVLNFDNGTRMRLAIRARTVLLGRQTAPS